MGASATAVLVNDEVERRWYVACYLGVGGVSGKRRGRVTLGPHLFRVKEKKKRYRSRCRLKPEVVPVTLMLVLPTK